MDKIVVFGSKYWPDCDPAKEYLLSKEIKHVYLDVSEGMLNLKMFLKYRDNYKEFDEIKKKQTLLFKKVLSAVIIFLLPWLIIGIMGLLGTTISSYADCYRKADARIPDVSVD